MQRNSRNIVSRPHALLWVITFALLVVDGGLALAGDTPKGPKQTDVFDPWLKLSPAERMLVLDKTPAQDRVFSPVTRGPLVQTILERGTLQAVQSSAVNCAIKSTGKGSTVATTIRWVVDDGTWVKKGDMLIVFDDSALDEHLKTQKEVVIQSESELSKAAEQLAGLAKENQLDVKVAEVDVRLAVLALRQYKGEDATQKEILELKVNRVKLLLERLKATAGVKEKQAAADRDVKKSIHVQELERLRESEAEKGKYVLHAPQDGLVVYHVPEPFGSGSQRSIVAQGEPVREGQRLMSISDLKRFAVTTRVHEASIARVRAGQKAAIRVDAFPSRISTGKVRDIATVASQADYFSSDVRIYPVTILFDGEPKDLRPGMSAEVRLTTGESPNCLRLPPSAVLVQSKEPYCYVLLNKKLELRKLKLGLRNEQFVEILAGLDEEDLVLITPHAFTDPLADPQHDGKQPAPGRLKPTQLRLRSVKLADDPDKRAFVNRYGLLATDFERIAGLPSVSTIVPIRSFPHEVRRLERMSHGLVVATTSNYAAAAFLQLAAGRFLTAADDEDARNVAVLGPRIARELFPLQNPVGESIVLNSHPYVIVGVLRNVGADEVAKAKLDPSVYIPLRTCKQRFGEKIYLLQAGLRRAEQVELTEIIVTLRDVADVPGVTRAISALLRTTHQRNDWDMDVPPAR